MIDLTSLKNVRLRGGFSIAEIGLTHEPLVDALGREAIALTRIVGTEFRLLIRSSLSDEELSVTLYHEILEAVSVASLHPPDSVANFAEADFERAARRMHDSLGEASPENLNRML
ncbi:MAG TPA: hypothetical protein VL486_14105 [Verrucomicrobiae bacterium]|nr:hypothetical protein [Verrucomicrobiae bacterium]